MGVFHVFKIVQVVPNRATHHILSMPKLFPGVLQANSNFLEKRVQMMLVKKEILELPNDSTDIYKKKHG